MSVNIIIVFLGHKESRSDYYDCIEDRIEAFGIDNKINIYNH
jgi:hypothetical protein